jgi:nitroreductase
VRWKVRSRYRARSGWPAARQPAPSWREHPAEHTTGPRNARDPLRPPPGHGLPLRGTDEEMLRALLPYATRAPSSHNTQPWRFRMAGDAIELRADPARGLQAIDPAGRELVISCGTALYQLRAAARFHGFAPEVEVFPDPADENLLARFRLGVWSQLRETRGSCTGRFGSAAPTVAPSRTGRSRTSLAARSRARRRTRALGFGSPARPPSAPSWPARRRERPGPGVRPRRAPRAGRLGSRGEAGG